MPNYVSNLVKVNAPTKERYNEVVNFVKGKEILFDFNKIIPMPEDLNITESSLIDLGIRYKELQKKSKEDYNEKDNRLLSEVRVCSLEIDELVALTDKALSNIEKYGYRSWYHWAIANWGTKWNAVDAEEWNEDENSILFYTAWHLPRPIYNKLSTLFPDVEFDVVFQDECDCFAGESIFVNGNEEVVTNE